jgi:uncharacterized protein YqhQ
VPAPEARYVGGQAVMEGVMMRGATTWAVAVRTEDGDIKVEVHDAPAWSERWSRWPLARGVATLVESMALGVRALTWSANQQVTPEEQLSKTAMGGSLAFALIAFSAVFILLPALAARGLGSIMPGGAGFAFAEGLVRLAMFLGYIVLVGRLPDIRRVFEYHGAEHKAIAAYENGRPLTVQEAQRFTTEHVRCGTNFLLTVMVVTILLHTLFGRPSWQVLIASRVLLIPVVAGVSYELIRAAARNIDRPWVRVLMTPGLSLQRLTTREPADDQVEVAITSLRAVLSAEQLAEVEARAA